VLDGPDVGVGRHGVVVTGVGRVRVDRLHVARHEVGHGHVVARAAASGTRDQRHGDEQAHPHASKALRMMRS